MSNQREPRFDADLSLRVFGMDASGHPFSQIAHALNISVHGAKLSGLEKQLKPGDIIGVQLGSRKARCKVIWVVDTGGARKIEAGVAPLMGQSSPWQNELATRRSDTAAIAGTSPAASEKRRFPRQRVPFPIEIRDEQQTGTHMQTNTADIAGSGCYIETRLPLPVKKIVTVTFWLNSEKVRTSAIVRTCDGGVGMGLEFTGLDEATQTQLQELVETMAAESMPLAKAHGAF